MFTATIVDKGIKDKSFLVNVSYSNGSISFNEVMDMTGGSLNDLSVRIQARLDQLNNTVTLIPQVTLGSFVPAITTPPSAAFIQALRHFQSCQRAVSYGLIQTTDQIYIDAQNTMKGAYDVSFIDLI